eukprot:366331-Chlamydomonas_euryale.AAC.6
MSLVLRAGGQPRTRAARLRAAVAEGALGAAVPTASWRMMQCRVRRAAPCTKSRGACLRHGTGGPGRRWQEAAWPLPFGVVVAGPFS